MSAAIPSPRREAQGAQFTLTAKPAPEEEVQTKPSQDPSESKTEAREPVKDPREQILQLLGDKKTEGKTKIIWAHREDPNLVILQAKDDITAGDGKKHDVIQGKAKLATLTTCNVFRLLSAAGIPVAFRKQLDETHFLADACDMIQYEVVVRAEAHGSYLKRHTDLKKGDVLPKLVVEFFLKTSGKTWKGTSIPKDDPFIRFTDAGAALFLPDAPIEKQEPFLTLSEFPLKGKPEFFGQMESIAKQTFVVLQKAWEKEKGRLVDFKVEFGITPAGKLLLADVIDNDSWRVIQDEQYIDKQVYRDGGDISQVASLYERVALATSRF